MEDEIPNNICDLIQHLKNKLEASTHYNGIKSTRRVLEKFRKLNIPPQDLIEHDLVNYMRSVGQRFSKLKDLADTEAQKWQQEVDLWMQQKKISEERVKPMNDNGRLIDESPIQPFVIRNDTVYKRSSSYDRYQYSHSSGSREVESPELHIHNQRNSSRSDKIQAFQSKLSSPSRSENSDSQNTKSTELSEESSDDPKEEKPEEVEPSPLKTVGHPSLYLEPNMFKAIKLETEPTPQNMDNLLIVFQINKVPEYKLPDILRNYIAPQPPQEQIEVNSDSSNCAKSLNDKKIDSQYLPSSKQETIDSSKTYPESKHDRKWEHQERDPFETKKSVERKHSNKYIKEGRHKESTPSIVKTNELKEEQRSALVCKSKKNETALPVPNAKELKQEQHIAQDSKLKHSLKTQPAVETKLNAKLDSQQDRKLKRKEAEQQPIQDAKRVCAMVAESGSCDKNNIKKRDSPDQSALIAITSSKKERTSMYHGGKKSEVLKLKEICKYSLAKALKQTSDPIKYIKLDVSFDAIEDVLIQLSPEKLYKIEEEKKYLIAETDNMWKYHCRRKFKSCYHLRKTNEPWRVFYERCCIDTSKKLKNLTASINASTSKVKPDRKIKLTTVDAPPMKRQKTDFAKCNGKNSNSTVKSLPNNNLSCNSKPAIPVPIKVIAPVPPKSISNHTKPVHKSKKDAPLMHKAKKTMGQLNRIRRS